MGLRWFFTSLFAVLALGTAVAWLAEFAGSERLNVIFLTVESIRAEVLSPETTPNLLRAARTGTLFTQHRAVSSWTAPNVLAILSGVSPFDQGVHTRGNSVAEAWRLPLEELADSGWRVAGLQAFMKMNLYRFLGLTVTPGPDPFSWMSGRAQERQPFVLWYHYVDTHLPYAPSQPFRPDWEALLPKGDGAARQRLRAVLTQPAIPAGTVDFRPQDKGAVEALYLGGIREFDAWFATFWKFLDRSGLRRNTIVVLTADHGEELLERGNVGHTSTTRKGHLHEEVVRVPLIVWLPPDYGGDALALIDAPGDHLDIMPTVMRLLGQTSSRAMMGTDLFALPPNKPWSAVTSQGGFAEPDPNRLTSYLFSRLEFPWKLLLETTEGRITRSRLFELADDPGETRDLAATRPDVAARLRDRLLPAILTMRPPSAGGEAGEAPAESPRWIFPKTDGVYAYDDLSGRFRMEWTGRPEGTYVIQYAVGEGALALAGEIEVKGTVKDFGIISRRYWDTWIVPYRTFRIRVGAAGRGDSWSPWLELRVKR